MRFNPNRSLVAAALIGALCAHGAYAQKAPEGAAPTKGFNTYIPPDVLTPDAVQTRIGTLNFVDGVPTEGTAELAFDNLDFLRGVEVFLNLMPAASIEAIRRSSVALGAIMSNQATIYDQLADSNPLLLTANTTRSMPLPCSTSRPMAQRWSKCRPAAVRGRSTTHSSASSSTWARPAPIAARAAST